MRRTTICRSSASLTAAVVLAGFAVLPAAAQQNPPSPPAGQSPAPSAPAMAQPATHVVQAGETLWGLARQYFGDPMLWPEIYRLNTDVVEDPHWIFPGEALRFQAGGTPGVGQPAEPTVVTITPTGDTVREAAAAPVGVQTPTMFRPAAAAVARQADLQVAADRAYRAVRQGEYYAAGFLTEGADLHSGRLLGNIESSAINRLSTRSTATMFTNVAFETPPGDTLHVGDLMLAIRREGDIRGYGDVIRPTGLLRVTGGSGVGRLSAQVVAVFGSINDGQEVVRVVPFQSPGSVRPAPVDSGVTGHVVGLLDPSAVVNLQNAIFINRGAEDGVRLGDVFEISGTDPARNADLGPLTQKQAEALIVSVRPHTATAMIIVLTRSDVRAGSVARQIRRMPS